MKKSIVCDRKKLFWFIIVLATSIYINILERISWINYYDKEFGILHISGYISLIVMIITSIILLAFIKKNKNLKFKKLLIIFIAILNIAIGYITLREYGNEVTCLSSIAKVSLEDGNSYFIINNEVNGNVKIKCDKVSVGNLIVHKKVLYQFDYRYLKFDKENGVLGSIDIDNPIDNR